MDVIHGYRDFMKSPPVDEHSWLAYISDYEQVFDPIFDRLYQIVGIEEKRALFASINANELIRDARAGVACVDEHAIRRRAQDAARFLQFDEDFDVYLLVGLGHIDGCALRTTRPFLYLGIERLLHTDRSVLIAHEMNHLVRFSRLDEYGKRIWTVGKLAIAEGLALLTALELDREPMTDGNLQRMLFCSSATYVQMNKHKRDIIRELDQQFDLPLTKERMNAYFMAQPDAVIPRTGYFYGMCIIRALIEAGHSIPSLTSQPTEEIRSLYKKLGVE
ncbi:DUF2268 domain-containing putative Zn-dependent protease [Geomicrobium sp. JSM 1781026]|uniref:DUF2268 domain-containing putative Zn-dependent protease n=1 Tax=Geomicrobium sp. JSM 1781026 TaxID=3344580 RepID=UPI0035C020A9